MLSIDDSVKYIIRPSGTDIDMSISELVNLLSNSTVETRLGQYYGELSENTNLLALLNAKYSNQAPKDTKYSVINLTYLRVEFNSDPWLIYDSGDGLFIVTDSSTQYDNLISGYIIYINGEPILIQGNFNYYELNDDDILITSVYIPKTSDVTIDYTCNLKITDESSDITYNTTTYTNVVGQFCGVFEPNDSLITKLQTKYNSSTDTYIIKLNALNAISIEADPGVVVYVKDSFDDIVYQHIISKNGVLKLEKESATIEEIYFGGKLSTNGEVDICSVEAIVDYDCEIMKGVY